MTNPQGHVWSSSFERRGDENRMITKCLVHPDAQPLATYDWPTKEELVAHEKEHEKSLPQEALSEDSENQV